MTYRSNAHQAGAEAANNYNMYLTNMPSNPYPFGTPEFNDWEDGFEQDEQGEF